MCNKPKLILASSSVYRQQLLAKLCSNFKSISPAIDETPIDNESALATVKRFAFAKANKVAQQVSNALVIASDQIGELNLLTGNHLLQKPLNHQNAIAQLQQMSGNEITFYTSLVVIKKTNQETKTLENVDITKIHFRELTRETIVKYLKLDKPYNCAGSFKIESAGIRLCKSISTKDINALIGLPLIMLYDMLLEFGWQD